MPPQRRPGGRGVRLPSTSGRPTAATARAVAAAACSALVWGAARADTVDARCDIYPRGSDHASAVLACSFSQRQGHVSIDRADGVRHELSPKAEPGTYVDENGRPAYRTRGLGKRGQIFRLAGESVYVYWSTDGLSGRGADAAMSPASAPSARPAAVAPGPFDKTLTLQGVTFRVVSANHGSINRVTITPAGLSIDNSPLAREIDGVVAGAEVADLDVDGSPEIYVYVSSAGSGSQGSLVAYGANRRQSLSEIHLPPVTEHPTASRGYMRHDEFAVVENRIVRRFPLYRPGDTNAAPSGGMRQLQYRLRAGEGGWVLELDRVVDF